MLQTSTLWKLDYENREIGYVYSYCTVLFSIPNTMRCVHWLLIYQHIGIAYYRPVIEIGYRTETNPSWI